MTDTNIDETKDPIYQDKQADDGSYKEPEKDITASIADRLGSEVSTSETTDDEIVPENPLPFDVKSLSRDQLQTLKAMLNATPDTQKKKKGNPKIFLRRIDDKLICNFKRAYLSLVDDPENNRKVERHIIPVQFFGEKEFKNILYSSFINSERVACEVISTRNKEEEFNEGETVSRETGTLVDMIRKEIRYWFTVKLPNGETTEIEARLANA